MSFLSFPAIILNMNIVHKDIFGLLCDPDNRTSFSIEASQLGLKPLEWPVTMLTTLGNGQPLRRSKVVHEGRELVAVIYEQQMSPITVKVFND